MANNGHIHIFKCEPANGPTSIGRCECGEERVLFNSMKLSHGVLNVNYQQPGKMPRFRKPKQRGMAIPAGY